MNNDAIRADIRGTKSEEALVAMQQAGGSLSHEDFAAAVGLPEYQAREPHLDLERLGLTSDTSDSDSVNISMKGSQIAEAVIRSRANGPDRRDRVQRAVLNWLDENPGVGSTKDFQGHASAAAFGIPFTGDEIEQATEFLRENQLIDGFQSLGGFQGPAIKYEGGYALHYDGLIAEFLKRGGSTTYDYSTSNTIGDNNVVGAQQGGQSNTANISQNVITVDQRARVLAGVGGLLAALDDADAKDLRLRSAIEAIRDAAAADEASESGVKERITQALAVAGASEFGHLAFQGLTHLLGLFMS